MRRFFHAATAGLDQQVVILSLASLVVMLGASVISPVLPLYAREFGVSYSGAGMLISGFAIGRLAFDYAGGRLADRFSPRLLGVVGALVTALSAFLSGMATSFEWLVAYRVLEGLGSAIYVITIMALFARTVPAAQMGKAMGFYQSQILLGVSFGPTLGGVVAEIWGMRAPFVVMSAFCVIVAVLTFATVTPVPGSAASERRPHPPLSRMMEHVANRTFLFILVLTFYVFAGRAGIRMNLIPLFGEELGGLSESQIGIILSASAFSNFAVLWHAGSLLDRSGRMHVAMPSLIATAAISAAFAISPGFWNLLVVSVLLGVALGYLAPAPAAMAADLTPRALMGSMMGIYRMGGDLGLLVGPVALGFVAERFGFEAAFVTSGLLALAVFAVGFRLPETLGRSHVREDAVTTAARIDAPDAGR